jgi:UDP-N-acetyl-D-glucosamine dehydrogenase
MNLEKKIKEKRAKVAVVGLGYVGLPTAVHIAKAGFEVFGIDIKKERVKKVNSGNSYIGDVKSEELKEVVKSKKLKAFANHLPLKNSDIVLICVPTPLDKVRNPDLFYVKETTKAIAKYLHKEQLIILESTCPPETTRKVILPELEKTGLKVGKDFYLAHCPERIDPGNKKWNSKNIPRVVGGITKKCTRLAKIFYRSFLEAEVFEVSSPEVAEMAKILENTFRLVNISMINELALLAGRMGIDIWEVIEAAKTKPFGFMPFYPSAKCGGHCIPIVPFFLSSKAKEYNFWTRFIELAGEINEQMPHFVMTKVIWVLNLKKKPVRGSKVLVWGVAYKKDIGDIRESAAFDIIADLIRKGARVDYFDPYVPEFEVKHRIIKKPVLLKSIKYSLQKIKKYDLVLILTDHSGFDYENIAQNAKLVVDTRNAIKSRKHKNVFWL